MAVHAVVNTSTDVIENVVEWDGETAWPAPAGARVVNIADFPEYQLGGTLTDAGDYTAPDPPVDDE